MTDQQMKQTTRLREEGYGYKRIAAILGLSENTIKAYCRRHGLTGRAGKNKPDGQSCLCCGMPVKQDPKRKLKKYCSDLCRARYWQAHSEQMNRKAIYHFECPCCHKEFTAYGNAGRKYCSHECYIKHRFGPR